jgi:hypothetical protein
MTWALCSTGQAFKIATVLRGRRRSRRNLALLLALQGFAVFGTGSAALALSGSPIKVAEGQFDGPPAVAVDASGTAYVAWANEATKAVTIHWCTIPAGAAGCSHSGELKPEVGTESHAHRTDVLVDGSTMVILAEVFGTASSHEGEPVEEWVSTDGGATFAIVDGGKSVTNGTISADTEAVNAVILPGTNVLGMGWVTAVEQPSFSAFALASPAPCSVEVPCEFAKLQPGVTEHLLGNPGGSIAAQSGSAAGVLGVYETLAKPGCSSGTFDSAYVFGSGAQSATNDYNLSPGTPGSAWRLALSPGDCEVEYLAAGGGPSGFGVLEEDLAHSYTVYHRFDQAHESFDTPYVTVAREAEQSPSVSQDGAGGVYATYLAGFKGEVRFAYSSDGGSTWSGPVTLAGAGGGELVSSVSPAGQGWAAWKAGEATYVQSFVAADATVAPPYKSLKLKGHSGGTVTIEMVPTESGLESIVLTVPTASLAAATDAKKCKPGQVKLKGRCVAATTTLGRASAKAKAGHKLTLTVHLSRQADALLAKGRTLHLTAINTFKPAAGTPYVHDYAVTVKGHRHG